MEAAEHGKGKQYTIADDQGTKSLVLRSKIGVFLVNCYDEQPNTKKPIFGLSSFMVQTQDGSILVIGSQKTIIAYDLKKNEPVFQEHYNYIYSVTISPNGNFLQILDKINSNEGITTLYSLPHLKKVAEYKENAQTHYYSKEHYPLIRFTSDDKCYMRYDTKSIHVYSAQNHQQISQIKCGAIAFFEISKISTADKYLVACLFLDANAKQGDLQLYQKDSEVPIYEKHIKKTQQIHIKFSPSSNQFLMELQTYYDPTGKSYYGEFGLYLYNDENKKLVKVKNQEGPVHDFSWHKSGDSFAVISGFMPAQAILLNKDNQKIMDFGKHHRNKIIWGNLGRFVCIAGFGNLNGQMDIWDLEKKKQIGYCKSNSASYCEWSPDDRKIMTNIVTPRLRVDNCFKIFAYTGKLLSKTDFSFTQLYESRWVKQSIKYEARGLSPGRKSQEPVKKEQGKFQAFGDQGFDVFAHLNPQKPKQAKPQQQVVPGQHPDDAAKKRKRKRYKGKDSQQHP